MDILLLINVQPLSQSLVKTKCINNKKQGHRSLLLCTNVCFGKSEAGKVKPLYALTDGSFIISQHILLVDFILYKNPHL